MLYILPILYVYLGDVDGAAVKAAAAVPYRDNLKRWIHGIIAVLSRAPDINMSEITSDRKYPLIEFTVLGVKF